MTTLRKYQTKDKPGSSIDIEARLLSANSKITYAEAVHLILLQNPELAQEYVDNSVEVRAYSTTVEKKGSDFDRRCKEYAQKTNCSYSDAVSEMIRQGYSY